MSSAVQTVRRLAIRFGHRRFDPTWNVWIRSAYMAFLMAVGFDVIIVLIAVFSGRYQTCGKSAGTGTCDYALLAITDPAGAALMGAVVGAAYPLFRYRWLAYPLGALAMLPWFAGIALADVSARAHWRVQDTVMVLVCSVFVGPALGHGFWKARAGTI